MFILFGYKSVRVQIVSGLIRFGSFRVRVYIGLIRVRVSSDSVRVSSDFGSLQFCFGSVLGRFNFGFRVEIGSTLFHVGSGLISNCSVRIVQYGSLLPGLATATTGALQYLRTTLQITNQETSSSPFHCHYCNSISC